MTKHSVSGVITLTVVAFLSAAPSPARAQEGDAREEFGRGQSAYAQGDYEAALEHWERAYALDPRPRLLYNISQAYERLGQLIEAAAALERYVEATPGDDPALADARAHLAMLRQRLARTAIVVQGGPDGAGISIDGTDYGRLPRPDPITVVPGSHTVRVSWDGGDRTISVVVPEGQVVECDLSSGDDAVASRERGTSADEPRIAAIVSYGLAGAALVSGVTLGALAVSDGDQAGARGDAGLAAQARDLALGADVLLGVSLTAAVVGLLLALIAEAGGDGPSLSLDGASASVGLGTSW